MGEKDETKNKDVEKKSEAKNEGGEKKKEAKNEGGEKTEAKGEGEKKTAPAPTAATDGGGKKEEGPAAIVLKLDLHCEGCAKKVKRYVRRYEGVEQVTADCGSGKLTVKGNVDPMAIRERIVEKTKKKVELVSPLPKKDGGGGGDKKSEKKVEADDKKPKEPPVSTVGLKIPLHCDGCINKIKRIILKSKGVHDISVDAQKDLVTIKGTMDLKELVPYLKEKLRRSVTVVPPKKDDGGGDKKAKEEGGETKKKEKETTGGGDGGGKKETARKDGESGEKKDNEGGKKEGEQKAASGGGDGGKSVQAMPVMEVVNKMEHYGSNPYTYYATPMYNQHYANQDYGVAMYDRGYPHTGYATQYSHVPPPPPPTYLNSPLMFSDENPNSCSIV